MTDSVKDRITNDLQTAKSAGNLRAERIRDIVQSAVSQAVVELKEGSGEIRLVVQDAISAVIETLGEKGKAAKEDVTASIEGVLAGISEVRRDEIVQTQSQVQQLQAELDEAEDKLEIEVEEALTEIAATSEKTPSTLNVMIEEVIKAVKDREELDFFKQQYAKLKAQLAILDANLAARYGERYEEVKQHLEKAKILYDNAKVKMADGGVNPIEQKQVEFESKMGEVGAALASKEQKIKHLLKELWQTATQL